MKISKQEKREAKELYRSCLADGALDDNRVREVVQRVLQGRPRGYLAILSHFQRLVKLALQQRSARIESPVPLAPDLQAEVQSSLTRSYGPGLDIAFVQNPSLLGGLRSRVGSDVLDGSIAARLAALEDSF